MFDISIFKVYIDNMDSKLLKKLGLSDSQARTYLSLIKLGQATPAQITELTQESRTNTYMILDRLVEMNLAEEFKKGKKKHFKPSHPSNLEKLAEEVKHSAAEVEADIKNNMPKILSHFYAFTEKPGIRMLEGEEGFMEVYKDTLREKKDIYFLRSTKDLDRMGAQFFHSYKKKRSFLGIKTHAYTQITKEGRDYQKDDEINKMERHWLPKGAYTAPVEIDVYGDKVAFIVFGEETMSAIIQSPSIAESMRQLLQMIEQEDID